VGGSTLVLLFFTFRHLPLGDATTIIFSSPVFVMIMSFLFLQEPCGFFRTLIVFLLLTGVVLIAKPPFIFQVRLSAHVLLKLSSNIQVQYEVLTAEVTNVAIFRDIAYTAVYPRG
jgi:drug/metabolite transporter (DMT)-like permease